jgi:hypothetical protein
MFNKTYKIFKDKNMSTLTGRIIKNKFLLSLGALVIRGSTILSLSSQVLAVNVPAVPIWSNEDAKIVCPAVCTASDGTWNVNWTTVMEGKSSVLPPSS